MPHVPTILGPVVLAAPVLTLPEDCLSTIANPRTIPATGGAS
jgi:hypothetical protein